MAKKKKTTAKNVVEKQPVDMEIFVKLRKAFLTYPEWGILDTWEKNSGKSTKHWRTEVSKLAMRSYRDNFVEKSKDWSEKDYHLFITAARRRMYDTDYSKIAKEFKISTNEYYIAIGGFSGYRDWATNKLDEVRTKYFSMNAQEQMNVENKLVKVIRDEATNSILNVIPLMKSFNAGEYREIPLHSYMGEAIGMAIPIEDYKAAIEEGEESTHWDALMPMVLNCNGEEFGNPDDESYAPLEAGKCYRMVLSNERGKKVGNDTDFYYAYEGKTSEEYFEDDDNKKHKRIIYEGPRSFQYNLKMVKKKDGNEMLVEVDTKEFDYSSNELMERAFDTWNLGYPEEDEDYERFGNNGLQEVPDWIANNKKPKDKYGSGLYPIACEASVIEIRINEPKIGGNKTTYSVRLDDRLDEKKIIDEDKPFTELSLYGVQFSEEQITKFKLLAPATRIKFIATINKKPKNRIHGSIFWFDIVVANASNDLSNVDNWVVEPEDSTDEFDDINFEIGEE